MKFELTHTVTIKQTFEINDNVARMMCKHDLEDYVQKCAETDLKDIKTVVAMINNNESLEANLDTSLNIKKVK